MRIAGLRRLINSPIVPLLWRGRAIRDRRQWNTWARLWHHPQGVIVRRTRGARPDRAIHPWWVMSNGQSLTTVVRDSPPVGLPRTSGGSDAGSLGTGLGNHRIPRPDHLGGAGVLAGTGRGPKRSQLLRVLRLQLVLLPRRAHRGLRRTRPSRAGMTNRARRGSGQPSMRPSARADSTAGSRDVTPSLR